MVELRPGALQAGTGRIAVNRYIVAHPNCIVVYRATDDTLEIVAVVQARHLYS